MDNESKHTPGPWVVRVGRYEGARIERDREPVALVPADETVEDPRSGQIHETVSDRGLANARLIAAAPDLLEALKTAMKVLNGLAEDGIWSYTLGEVEKVAQRAIDKAEGRA